MKAGKIFLWVAGIGTVGILAAFALYKPTGLVIWDTKNQTGSVTLGGNMVAFNPTMGSSTAKSWNGYQLTINGAGGGASYTLVRFGNVIENGNLTVGNAGSGHVTLRIT